MNLVVEIPNLAWRVRNALSQEDLQYLRENALVATTGIYETATGNNSVADTAYRWLFVRDDIELDLKSQNIVKKLLENTMNQLGHAGFKIMKSPLQDRLMETRRFDGESFIELHVERRSEYGLYHYVLFLSETVGGEVVFYSKEDALNYVNETPERQRAWEVSAGKLGKELFFADKTVQLKPEMNSVLLFKVGCPHAVNSVVSAPNTESRLTVNGWIDPEKHFLGGPEDYEAE